MRNQFEQDDWYNQSENRRQQDRNGSNAGNDFRNRDNDRYGYQDRYSNRGYQGKSRDLHSSHPYDYGQPTGGSQDMGSGYFSPPSYPTSQGQWRNNPYQSRQDAGSRQQDNWNQNRWSGERNASYQDRGDYMRDRDRHSAPQNRENQDRYRSEDQNDFRQRNQFNPRNREEDNYGSSSNQWKRSQGNNNWQDSRQQNGHENRQHRDFLDRAGDQVRSWFGDEEAERRRRMDEINDRSNRGETADYHQDKW
jgi:hypothetical protein